jgi:uncharacterized protein (TIGR02678 family)
VHRRLLTESALYYDELPGDERDYARQRRTRIREELERLTGCTLECRAEGQALIGLPAADPFPAGGAVAQAALLLGSELAVAAAHDRDPATSATQVIGRVVGGPDVEAAWRRVVSAYTGRFTTEYRADPDRLRAEALALLQRLDLIRGDDGGALLVRPALARYRADVALPETLGV